MTSPTASVQLITFGERTHSDPDGVFAEVAAAGFPAIEAGNLFAMLGETKARELLAKHNLKVSGAHTGYGDYADSAKLDAYITYAQAIGLKHLMCSGVADGGSADGYKRSAEVFNRVGRKLADAGLTFNYHNHDWEFKDLGTGLNGMQVLSSETDPGLVKFNIDVFWLYYAGLDPVTFIAQHADRAGYFHFKDGRRVTGEDGKSHPEFLELGIGSVNLKSAYQAALQAGATWIVAEQDTTKRTPAESIAISRDYLRTLGV